MGLGVLFFMTVAVSCNLSDGVVLGVDSAVTLPGPNGIIKVYENAEKLFQLGDKPIGIATFGLGGFSARSIGSYVREFELLNPDGVVTDNHPIDVVVEALRTFFMKVYLDTVIPALDQIGQKYEDIPVELRPSFGLVVGGFSPGAYLSEVWVINLPQNEQPDSAFQQQAQGEFGTSWFASFEPIGRYIKGFDPALIDDLLNYVSSVKGGPFKSEEVDVIYNILGGHEYRVPYVAMPLQEGIAHTRFLVELAINHHRFAVGAPVVGGKARLGMVTYKGEKFQLLEG